MTAGNTSLAELLDGAARERRMAMNARRWFYREMDRRGRVATSEIRDWLTDRHPNAEPSAIEWAVKEATRPIRTGTIRKRPGGAR